MPSNNFAVLRKQLYDALIAERTAVIAVEDELKDEQRHGDAGAKALRLAVAVLHRPYIVSAVEFIERLPATQQGVFTAADQLQTHLQSSEYVLVRIETDFVLLDGGRALLNAVREARQRLQEAVLSVMKELSSAPGKPTNVTAAPDICAALVRWSPPPGNNVEGYRITFQDGALLQTIDVDGNATQAHIEQLQSGGTYTFTVTAYNDFGLGPSSSPSRAITLADLPGAPINLVARAERDSVVLSWDPPVNNGGSPITYYEIAYDDTANFNSLTVGANLTTKQITGLTSGITYNFSVRARNAVGTGPSSATAPGRVLTTPTAPRDLQLAAVVGGVTVSWLPPNDDGGSPVVSYTLSWSADGGPARQRTLPAPPGAGSVDESIGGLEHGRSYRIAVQASNDIGDGQQVEATVDLVDGANLQSFADVLASSAALAANPQIDDSLMIAHLQAVAGALTRFARDRRMPLPSSDDLVKLTENWSAALARLPDPPAGAPGDGAAAVGNTVDIHDLLDRNYEILRNDYSIARPLDLANL